MARELAKLSPRGVATLKTPGRHSDGGGLYLVVDASGAKRWIFLYRWKRPGEKGAGRLSEMGLGSFTGVSLEKARKKAIEARGILADRKDPITERNSKRECPTFGAMADEVIAMRAGALRNEKSKARWKRALETYAAALRPIRVDEVNTEDVLKTLNATPPGEPDGTPFWTRTPESAKLTRGYIEAVLDAARAKGFRTGENPARWRGHLDHLLSKPKRLTRGHHAAMAFADVPAFLTELRGRASTAALGLEFLILTAARSGEVLGARWSEFDLKARVWTVPAARMNARREHRVPLSDRTLEMLETAAKLKGDGDDPYVFPGKSADKPLSSMAFEMLLRRMKLEVTTHGFRSSFRDWAGEATKFPREVAEAALAHSVGDSAEQAYRRGDALEKRKLMMNAWAGYCGARKGNVVPFGTPRAKRG